MSSLCVIEERARLLRLHRSRSTCRPVPCTATFSQEEQFNPGMAAGASRSITAGGVTHLACMLGVRSTALIVWACFARDDLSSCLKGVPMLPDDKDTPGASSGNGGRLPPLAPTDLSTSYTSRPAYYRWKTKGWFAEACSKTSTSGDSIHSLTTLCTYSCAGGSERST